MAPDKKIPAFWDNMLYDLLENDKGTKEYIMAEYGESIREEFEAIADAIKDLDLKKALKLIEESITYY